MSSSLSAELSLEPRYPGAKTYRRQKVPRQSVEVKPSRRQNGLALKRFGAKNPMSERPHGEVQDRQSITRQNLLRRKVP